MDETPVAIYTLFTTARLFFLPKIHYKLRTADRKPTNQLYTSMYVLEYTCN